MENITALKSAASAPADTRRTVSSGGVDDVLFAAFVMNIDTVKPQDRVIPRPAQKAEQNDDKTLADKPEQTVRKAEKTEEKVPNDVQSDDESQPEKVTIKADALKTASSAKKDNTVGKTEYKKIDDAIVAVAEEVLDTTTATTATKSKEFSLPEQASDTAVVKTTEAHSNHDDAGDAIIVVTPVVQLVAHNEKHEGSSKKGDIAAALADTVADITPETLAPEAVKQQAAGKTASALQNIAANDDKAADDADFDAAVDAILATLANTEAKNAKAAARASSSAANDAAKPLGDAVQNLVAGGSQASPLLSGQAIGQNQPALPHSFQAGAPSATSPSSDITARPIGLSVQQLESSKAGEVRLAKLPVRTAEHVQEQVAIKLRYAAKAGEKSVNIQLRPEELGRVDIKLDFKDGNQVTAKVTADTQIALDILKRDAVGMERVLNGAGLQLEENGLQFSLRDDGSEQAGKRGFRDALNNGTDADWDDNTDDYVAIEATPTPSIAANGRVNIVI